MPVSEAPTRLDLVEDRFAILDLTADYNAAWDDGQVDTWVATFIEDGEFILKGAPQTKGSEMLRKMITAMLPVHFVHLTMDQRIVVSGDSATQRARAVLGQRSPKRHPGSARWMTTGSYADNLIRTPQGWRFVSRTFAPDAALGDLPTWW